MKHILQKQTHAYYTTIIVGDIYLASEDATPTFSAFKIVVACETLDKGVILPCHFKSLKKRIPKYGRYLI